MEKTKKEYTDKKDNNQYQLQWFPGHMAKTRRLMAQCLPLIDVVVEIIDARIPYSSRNPEIEKIVGNKPRVVLLNKCDSADDKVTSAWCSYFEKRGVMAIPTDCRSGKGLRVFGETVNIVIKDKLERLKAKGMVGRSIRLMIVGVPNVGKSSFINRMAGARRTKVEDRPGVTRGKQWVKIDNRMELLDMPGVLWPKFNDKKVGEHLAFTGAIKDDIMDIEGLSALLAGKLGAMYPELVTERYGLTAQWLEGKQGHEILEEIGRKRGMLVSGGKVDTLRAAIMLIDEFRAAKIGRISLEAPFSSEKSSDNV